MASFLVLVLFCLRIVAGIGTLTDDDLRGIPAPSDDDLDIRTGKLLAPILIPRVPGTEGSLQAQRHFVDFFKTSLPSWELTWQNSTSKTPATGDDDVPFANMIFRRDPPGSRAGDVARVTLVAHYDSKIQPEGFVGATDSAAPCAMLLHAARSIDEALTAKWDAADELDDAVGLQIVFLDGEEAFVSWTDDDSLYGARSLAEAWESEYHESMSTYQTPLHAISLFVLLDLLGAKDPVVPSYFLPTHWAYKNMAALEKRMRDLGLLEAQPTRPFFPDTNKHADRFSRAFVQDDHIPFMKRGVDILHLIPTPFPSVWHTIMDDGEHLHMPTVRDWARIVTAFAAEWMELSGHLPAPPKRRSETETEPSRRTEL